MLYWTLQRYADNSRWVHCWRFTMCNGATVQHRAYHSSTHRVIISHCTPSTITVLDLLPTIHITCSSAVPSYPHQLFLSSFYINNAYHQPKVHVIITSLNQLSCCFTIYLLALKTYSCMFCLWFFSYWHPSNRQNQQWHFHVLPHWDKLISPCHSTTDTRLTSPSTDPTTPAPGKVASRTPLSKSFTWLLWGADPGPRTLEGGTITSKPSKWLPLQALLLFPLLYQCLWQSVPEQKAETHLSSHINVSHSLFQSKRLNTPLLPYQCLS